MNLTELKEKIDFFHKEVGCNGEKIASHNTESTVSFFLGDKELKIKEIDFDWLPGCNCWRGIVFELEESD